MTSNFPRDRKCLYTYPSLNKFSLNANLESSPKNNFYQNSMNASIMGVNEEKWSSYNAFSLTVQISRNITCALSEGLVYLIAKTNTPKE